MKHSDSTQVCCCIHYTSTRSKILWLGLLPKQRMQMLENKNKTNSTNKYSKSIQTVQDHIRDNAMKVHKSVWCAVSTKREDACMLCVQVLCVYVHICECKLFIHLRVWWPGERNWTRACWSEPWGCGTACQKAAGQTFVLVSEDTLGLSDTLPLLNDLEGGKLTPTNPLCCPQHPLNCLAIEGGAVPIPGCDVSCKDAFSSGPAKQSIGPMPDVLICLR